MELKFEWDEKKNIVNIKKHGVSFEEAEKVFFDPEYYEMYDEIHSLFEKRWIIIGLAGLKILKVVFTEIPAIITAGTMIGGIYNEPRRGEASSFRTLPILGKNGIIRIISARKADKYDEEVYFYGYGTKNSKFR